MLFPGPDRFFTGSTGGKPPEFILLKQVQRRAVNAGSAIERLSYRYKSLQQRTLYCTVLRQQRTKCTTTNQNPRHKKKLSWHTYYFVVVLSLSSLKYQREAGQQGTAEQKLYATRRNEAHLTNHPYALDLNVQIFEVCVMYYAVRSMRVLRRLRGSNYCAPRPVLPPY